MSGDCAARWADGDSRRVATSRNGQILRTAVAPMALNRPTVAARSALKVAVLNVAGGADFDAIVACLARPPLADAGTLLLCEASWRMPRHGMVEFAPALAPALKMSFVFVPSFGRGRASRRFSRYRQCDPVFAAARGFPRRCVAKSPFGLSASSGRRASGRPRQHQGRWSARHDRSRASGTGWDPEGRGRQMEAFLRAIGRRSAGHYWRRPQYDHDGHGPAVVAACGIGGDCLAPAAVSRAAAV